MDIDALFSNVGNQDRLVDRVVNEVQRLIVGAQLQAGAKLPPQRELAEQLGVSRTVLREAVHVLVTKGLLTSKPGVGTTVREVSAGQIAEPLILMLRTHRISLDHLYQVRSILEVQIATLAASEADEQDIASLNSALDSMRSALDDPEALADLDAQFHESLARATHNPLLVVLLGSIRHVMRTVRLVVHQHPDLRPIILDEHEAIQERVAAKDPSGASHAMAEHLQHAWARQKEILLHV